MSGTDLASLVVGLSAAFGDGCRIDVDPACFTPYGGVPAHRPLARLEPRSVGELQEIVRHAARHQLALVPQGGLTGLADGAIPSRPDREVLVSLAHLNRVVAVDPINLSIVAEAGATVDTVDRAAAAHGLAFPFRIGSSGAAQIGGVLSTNAGGLRSWRHGSLRRLVLGLEAVLPDASLWSSLRTVRKGNLGLDVGNLLIGAEGTLGFITAAALELGPRAVAHETAFIGVDSPDQAVALFKHIAAGGELDICELISGAGMACLEAADPALKSPLPDRSDWNLLLEWSTCHHGRDLASDVEAGLASAHAAGLFRTAVVARSERERAALWALRERHGAACRRAGGRPLQHDLAVPVSAIARFLDQAGKLAGHLLPAAQAVPICHVGDGNIHFDLLAPSAPADGFHAAAAQLRRALHDLAIELGGVFSAEHGIGSVRRDELHRLTATGNYAAMRTIKQVLDPLGLMNPGKLLFN